MFFGRRFSETTDGDLVARAAEGDEGAFEELLRRHQDAVYRFALRFLGDAYEAEDVTQEVFMRLFQTAKRYRPRGTALRTYLLRVARNLCIDGLRKKRPLSMESPPEMSTEETPLDRLERAEAAEDVARAVAALPDSQRAAVLLRHDQGLSYDEIARVMETTVPAVESLLVRGRRALRRRLASAR